MKRAHTGSKRGWHLAHATRGKKTVHMGRRPRGGNDVTTPGLHMGRQHFSNSLTGSMPMQHHAGMHGLPTGMGDSRPHHGYHHGKRGWGGARRS